MNTAIGFATDSSLHKSFKSSLVSLIIPPQYHTGIVCNIGPEKVSTGPSRRFLDGVRAKCQVHTRSGSAVVAKDESVSSTTKSNTTTADPMDDEASVLIGDPSSNLQTRHTRLTKRSSERQQD